MKKKKSFKILIISSKYQLLQKELGLGEGKRGSEIVHSQQIGSPTCSTSEKLLLPYVFTYMAHPKFQELNGGEKSMCIIMGKYTDSKLWIPRCLSFRDRMCVKSCPFGSSSPSAYVLDHNKAIIFTRNSIGSPKCLMYSFQLHYYYCPDWVWFNPCGATVLYLIYPQVYNIPDHLGFTHNFVPRASYHL